MLNAMSNVLDIELRDKVREEAGGTYDISAYSEMYHYPHGGYNLYIGFGCAPDQVGKLSSLVIGVTDKIKKEGPLESDVAKVREQLKRELETNFKQNNFWLMNLQYYYIHGLEPATIAKSGDLIAQVTKQSVMETAKKFLEPNHKATVILYPENSGK
jgi:zinc protease